jgi:hypothetical protein
MERDEGVRCTQAETDSENTDWSTRVPMRCLVARWRRFRVAVAARALPWNRREHPCAPQRTPAIGTRACDVGRVCGCVRACVRVSGAPR